MLLNTELSTSPCTSFVFQEVDHVSTISSQGKKEARHATHQTGDDAWCCLGLSEKTLDIFFKGFRELHPYICKYYSLTSSIIHNHYYES